MAETLTVAEAAQTLNIPERTLRRWITLGKVPCVPDPTGHRVRLIPATALPTLAALRQVAGQDQRAEAERGRPESVVGWPERPVAGQEWADSGRPGERLRLNIRRHPLSLTAATARAEAAERERQRLTDEVHFLRTQLHQVQMNGEVTFLRERLVEAERAERELRLLLAQQATTAQHATQALQAKREQQALPAPRKVRWWWPWHQ
jgi:excisionase family DNA binding protein